MKTEYQPTRVKTRLGPFLPKEFTLGNGKRRRVRLIEASEITGKNRSPRLSFLVSVRGSQNLYILHNLAKDLWVGRVL